LRVLSNS